MAKRTKKQTRDALRTFAKGQSSYSPAYSADKAELVYQQGKNYGAGPGKTYANVNAGASAADTAGKGYIYMNGVLYTTASGTARVATSTNIAGTTLDLTTGDALS